MLCLCLFSGLWKLLKVEDLNRWSESPLKFHAKFEGMCIRAFIFWGEVHDFYQRREGQHDNRDQKTLRTFMRGTTWENKRGRTEVGEKMNKKEEKSKWKEKNIWVGETAVSSEITSESCHSTWFTTVLTSARPVHPCASARQMKDHQKLLKVNLSIWKHH